MIVRIMKTFAYWLRRIFPSATKIFLTRPALLLPLKAQIKRWRMANNRMSWNIKEEEFERIGRRHQSSRNETDGGSLGTVLFYGFGDDGAGHSDAVLSGRVAWDYACVLLKSRVWQSPYINFGEPDAFRLRPGAPLRPKGFYCRDVRMGERIPGMTAAKSRKHFNSVTGLGPEGFQLLCITHTHFPDLMSERKITFMTLADYDVAPYGFNDFIDIPQIFSSNRILGLGIGNADHDYPNFGIPVMVLQQDQ